MSIKQSQAEQADYERKRIQFLWLCKLCTADISQFRELLRQGVEVNDHDEEGKHPLGYVSYNGRDDLVLLFLEHKAKVDLPTNEEFGETALIEAATAGQIKCATILLKYNANVNFQRKLDNNTPLIQACTAGQLKMAVFLIDNGAALDHVNLTGNTALYYACFYQRKSIVKLLLDKGANPNKGILPPVYCASQRGYLDILELLVNRGGMIDQPTDEYNGPCATPLITACARNQLQVAKYLVSKGARVNYQQKQGLTSLHVAAENGHRAVVRLLIESQAKLDIKDNDGETPLDKARQKGHLEIVRLLERADHTSSAENEESSSDVQAEGGKPSVPSGHILTREELQVLGALLSRFNDEKLKSIQLSLQEEQEIRDISLEEVKKSLRQSGLASMADGLKDDIEKGQINMKHYEAYEEALKGGLCLTLRYLKFLFFGPPRSGKTSTRRRLIKDIINLSQLGVPLVSTGIAETNDVIIKKLTSEPAAIAGSQWWSMKRSKEGTQLDVYAEEDLGYIAQLFYQLIYLKGKPPDPSDLTIVPASTTVEGTKQDELPDNGTKLQTLMRLSDTEKSEIDDAFKKLTTILQSDSPEDLKLLLEDLMMINMTDIGGQPAFLEMLPALTIGPALYLLFFRLDQELQEHYPVRFLQDEKGEEIVLETSYCIEEVLYQCLASIACFSSSSQADPRAASKSGALLFGTFKDMVDDARISQVQRTLEDKFKATKLYEEGLLLKPRAPKNRMAFTVDNMKGTEETEMKDIREDIEGIIKTYFPAIPIPASWLMFRVVLHLLNKPVLSLAQCEEIAKRLSMPTPVQEAIWFFHHNIGSLMHYSNIPSMENTVICNPQVIFDSISKLIIDKFQVANRAITAAEIEEFHQRGFFTLSHIQDATDHPRSSLLELNQVIDVLKHHNILAEVKRDEEVASSSESEPEPKFIMPAVMKYASDGELLSPSSAIEAMPSIFVHFDGGFVPFGVFYAGVVHLIAQLDSMSPRWQLCDDQVMRNKVKFIVDGAFFATLVSRPQYIMVHVEQHPEARCRTTLEIICCRVRKTVVQALETVILNMKYKPYRTLQVSMEQPFELAFTCNLEDSHNNHFMIVTMDDNGHHAKCLKSRVDFDLKDKHLIWFKDETGTSTGPLWDFFTDDMKCPVCLNVHVDPCTLFCGHTFCQLCLARMWKSSNKHCPVCKITWKVLPSISFDYKRNIEGAHGHEVEQLRKEYSHEDRELIEKFLEAKRISTLPSEGLAQELEEKRGVWKLPCVEVCGETSVVVHSSQGQLVKWNGLKLHIHAGSLPEGSQQCTIFIKASLAGEYEIPENTSLVSAIFWLRCEPQCTFIKPVTVEIQHCSTQQDLSKLKIIRALCSQKSLPYKFKPLRGGSFNADTFYGAIDMKGFSGVGVIDESPNSERMYYSQLFYRSYLSHQQSHEIHITFVWNDEAHINHISREYPEDSFFAGCHRVIEIEGKEIEVALDTAKWTTVMDGRWEILPAQPIVTKAELDDFKPGRGLPNCVLKVRPLCEDSRELLHEVILNGIKPPHHKVLLSYRSDRDYHSGASVQDPQSPPTVQTPSSERLPPQQQFPRSSVVTSRTTQHQLNSDTAGQQTKIDNLLKIDDLMDVKGALWKARAKWKDIGRCIGVDEGTLDTMKGKDSDCFGEMLKNWLRGVYKPGEKNSKPRTWHTLIEALRDKIVNEEVMANKLEKEKYPDTNQDQYSPPSESDVPKKGVNDKDYKTLSNNGINPGFLLCAIFIIIIAIAVPLMIQYFQ